MLNMPLKQTQYVVLPMCRTVCLTLCMCICYIPLGFNKEHFQTPCTTLECVQH